jgi:hypothetical protein
MLVIPTPGIFSLLWDIIVSRFWQKPRDENTLQGESGIIDLIIIFLPGFENISRGNL